MPIRKTGNKKGTEAVLKNVARESEVVHWLMYDGWQVFVPMLDNPHKTDVLISDGPNYYRLQVKTIEAKDASQELENLWKDSYVDIVICFARNSGWGYVMPAFEEDCCSLNSDGHEWFEQKRNSFLKAFHRLEV